MRVLVGVTTALLVISISSTALAHSQSSLEQWEDSWFNSLEQKGMSIELGLEWVEMVERHPWYFGNQETVTTSGTQMSTGGSSSRSNVTIPQGSSVEQWRGLVVAYFPAEQVDRALCIVYHESRGDPNADNPNSTATGLFQILYSLWGPHYGVTVAEMYNPEVNTRIAADLWSKYGWWPWSPYKRGECR